MSTETKLLTVTRLIVTLLAFRKSDNSNKLLRLADTFIQLRLNTGKLVGHPHEFRLPDPHPALR